MWCVKVIAMSVAAGLAVADAVVIGWTEVGTAGWPELLPLG
jgi:hypothetical protein